MVTVCLRGASSSKIVSIAGPLLTNSSPSGSSRSKVKSSVSSSMKSLLMSTWMQSLRSSLVKVRVDVKEVISSGVGGAEKKNPLNLVTVLVTEIATH